MFRNPVLLTIFLIIIVMGVAHIAYYHPKLPDTVAIHFNARGEPDGFASRNVHTTTMIGLQVFSAVIFLGIGWLVRVLPASLINIPNKEYWFDPARRTASLDRIGAAMLIFGIGNQLFFIGITHMTTMHNLGLPGMAWFWPLFSIYMVFVIAFCMWIFIGFRMPPDAITAAEIKEAS